MVLQTCSISIIYMCKDGLLYFFGISDYAPNGFGRRVTQTAQKVESGGAASIYLHNSISIFFRIS